jgi:outer membrane protein OmpA-like peptidoglycan-associated protein
MPQPERSPEPPTQTAPSPELMVLIEEVVPDKKLELLAPVLFKFDSDELEPVGVAMLHEVARELGKRTEIELLEIQGYADNRGSDPYNVELSVRRATRVREWLVEHGVDPARLQVAAKGEREPVQAGETEPDHEQNRRVVFRVLRLREP